ncbi:MAG: hypothetical protein AAFX52_04200 [Pseudomonadota bacterium]
MTKSLNSRVDHLWARGRITPQELSNALKQAREGEKVRPEHQPFVDVLDAEIAARQSSSGAGALERLKALLDAKATAMADE